ncbi:MAG: RloB domain-containing protein [Endozoicomonadaceae bacterium]|nr:RloB domain-containing protein [Endozoicomonadaceae bacterium]
MPTYKKADKGIYAQLMNQTSQAIAYSKRVEQQAGKTTTDNPSTMMHVLVEYLQNLAS